MTPETPHASQRWARPDVLSGAVLFGLATFAWVAARDLSLGTLHQPGPGFFPRSLAALLAGLALALLLRGLVADPGGSALRWPERAGSRRVAAMLAALLGYVLILEPVGYLLATLALFLLLLRTVGRQGWPTTLAVALCAAFGSHLLFVRWLMVSLPAGVWAP